MNTIAVKVPETLDRDLGRAARAQRLTKSEIVRRALVRYLAETGNAKPFVSAAEHAAHLAGCLDGGPSDLATNPKHMEKYGR